LGFIYRETGDPERAEAVWIKGITAARNGKKRSREESLCFSELVKLYYVQARDPLPLLDEGLSYFPDNRILQWIRGKLSAERGDYEAAARVFEGLAEIDPDTLIDDTSYDRRLFGAHAMIERAKIELARERKSDAAFWFAQAAKHKEQMDHC
jgi:predicted Zn-dependent protease